MYKVGINIIYFCFFLILINFIVWVNTWVFSSNVYWKYHLMIFANLFFVAIIGSFISSLTKKSYDKKCFKQKKENENYMNISNN